MEMFSTHNEEKSVVAEGFIRILKTKIYKYMTPVSTNACTDKLDDIVHKYNKTYIKIKMKSIDVKSSRYSGSSKDINNINIIITLILLEYQNINIFLQKVTLQIGLKKFLWLKKLKILCRGHMLLMILIGKKLLERFQKEFRIEKVMKRKVDNYMLNGKIQGFV